MAQSFAFKVEGVEPPGYRDRPDLHQEFWRTVVALVLSVKDRELAEGKDALGQPMTPISLYTREHRKSAMGPADPNAPPLTPAYGLSRTRSLLDGRAHAAQHHALFFWRVDPVTGQHWGKILGYHRKGSKKLPVRNVIGLSPAGRAEVQRRARQWWDARVRHVVPVPTPAKTPAPAGATLLRSLPKYQPKNPAAAVPEANRRIGQVEVNGHVYTLQGGSFAQINRAAANGSFSGFRQVKTTGKYNFGYGRFQPPGSGPTPPSKPNPPKRGPKRPTARQAPRPAKREPVPPPPAPRPIVPPRGVTAPPPAAFLEHGAQLDARLRPTVERLARQHGITPEEYVVRAEQALKDAADAGELVMRQPVAKLLAILSDGRVRSQFETGTSQGLLDLNRRRRVEEKSLGLPQDLAAQDRPVYGFLAPRGPDGPTGQVLEYTRAYGRALLRIKDSVRDRTRLTVGDSLDRVDRTQSSPVEAPALRSTYGLRCDPPEDLVELRTRQSPKELLDSLARGYNYVEAQFMGGLSVDDIAEVLFEFPPPPDVSEALARRGIPWRVVPRNP